MPEAITISEPQSPALSPENEEMLNALAGNGQGESQLLAGKYKSVEDLEKGYKELQSKLSQRGQTSEATAPADEAEQSDEQDSDDEPAEPSGDAKEIYGEFIGSRLEEAGIDFGSMNTRWQQTGELTGEDYTQLEQAGFTKDMVDAYLSGLQYKAAKDSDLSAQQVAAVKAEFGGEQGYAQMLEWAAENLSQDEIDGFNTIVNGSNMPAIKLAISGLQARYNQQAGREPKLIGGKASKASNDKFESTAQLVAAMQDGRYTSDPAYRRKVEEKLARSSIF